MKDTIKKYWKVAVLGLLVLNLVGQVALFALARTDLGKAVLYTKDHTSEVMELYNRREAREQGINPLEASNTPLK